MSSNSVCNHTHDETNQTLTMWSSHFVYHSYNYRPNWTPLGPITVINHNHCGSRGKIKSMATATYNQYG